jgi:RNA polymerase sigma factor (sigma-70 family)
VTAPDSVASESERLTAELERLRPGLRIIALRMLGDAEAANDAVQEALSRAILAIEEGRLADPAKLAAYVAGIARHVCSHVVRDRKETTILDDFRDQRPDPLESLITDADLVRLRAAFTSLSRSDQQLLRVHFGDDALAQDAVSDRVRKQKSRALARLRRAFFGSTGHERSSDGTTER